MHKLLDFISDDVTLITVNRRLARTVVNAYAERRLAAGERAWRTPDVVPFATWIERSWRECDSGSGSLLLRPAQERLLWEQVIREHAPPNEADRPLLEVGAAVRGAVKAFALVNSWHIPLDSRQFDFSDGPRSFRAWARAFRGRCQAAGWMDSVSAATALAEGELLAAARPRPRVVFAGFDFVTPQQQAVRAALARLGVEVVEAPPSRREARCAFRAFDDAQSELRAAALWARSRLIDAPDSRLGVVVPELHRVRAAAERIFDELLSPGCAMPGGVDAGCAFNLSYGASLSRVEVIGDALIGLKLAAGAVALTEAGRLLRSPFLGAGQSALWARARLDAGLREIGEPELTLDSLAARAARGPSPELDFDKLIELRRSAPRRQPLRSWSEFFSRWLWALGWPGERHPDSGEFQAVEAFRGLLDELAGMGAVAGPVSLQRALSLFLELAEETVFQPRSAPAPVQILGALEMAGLAFDGLWISGMHDGCWPPAPEPDPLVPVSLQRAAGVPAATPDGQLRLAEQRLRAWCRAADDVVLSYPRYQNDEPLRPSPLIAAANFELAEDRVEYTPPEFSLWLNRASARLEKVDDRRAPPLRITRGGARVIADQAACPFRAFARWRLGADAVPVADSPMDARTRGNVVHHALSALWSDIRTHSNLTAMPMEALRQRISSAVDQAMTRERPRRPQTLRGCFARIEQARLCALIEAWIEGEKTRAPFEVVVLEETRDVLLGPLSLEVRPDRIDRLDNGDHFVIDYKTGDAQVRDWFGERPQDPQLAIYTLAAESDGARTRVAGAAYGVLKRGKVGFRGLADRDGLAADVSDVATTSVRAAKSVNDWPALKLEWRRTLEALAEAYASGDARVDPKTAPGTCANCRVMPFCRVFEQEVRDDEGATT